MVQLQKHYRYNYVIMSYLNFRIVCLCMAYRMWHCQHSGLPTHSEYLYACVDSYRHYMHALQIMYVCLCIHMQVYTVMSAVIILS